MIDLLQQKIILASASPRRHELMEKAGFHFEVKYVSIDEERFEQTLPPEEVPQFLAKGKAEASLHLLSEGEILLTADTVVVLDGQLLGKPTNAAMAQSFIRRLAGNTHRVATGVCLMNAERQRVSVDYTDVTLAEMTDEEIEFYVERYQPFDKAGGYGIQDWIGICKVSKIEGSYTNVMGLPMQLVYRELQAFLAA